jgi:hypothetical protein
MLNMISPAEAHTATAAERPLAGFGAGAFACEGTWTGSRTSRKAAGPALPRIRHAEVDSSQGIAPAGSASRAYETSVALASPMLSGSVAFGSGQGGAIQNFIQTTRIPVIPGGLGSHPAREPDPV